MAAFSSCRQRSLATLRTMRRFGSRSRWSGWRRTGSVSVYFHNGFFQPMDTLRDKRQLEDLWASGKAPMESLVRATESSHMRILITGNMGYVGPVLTRFLRATLSRREADRFRHRVFRASLTGAGVLPETLLDRQVSATSARFPPELLDGVDAVVHLSAVSNDPMGNKFETVTGDINRRPACALRNSPPIGESRASFSPPVAVCTATPRAARARKAIRQIR